MESLYFAKEHLAKEIYAALPPTRALAQVTVAEIGGVAARVFEEAGRFTRFDLASDQLRENEALAILSRAAGHPFVFYQLPLDVIRQRLGQDAAGRYGRVFSGARCDPPDVTFHDFESWTRMQDWNALLLSA